MDRNYFKREVKRVFHKKIYDKLRSFFEKSDKIKSELKNHRVEEIDKKESGENSFSQNTLTKSGINGDEIGECEQDHNENRREYGKEEIRANFKDKKQEIKLTGCDEEDYKIEEVYFENKFNRFLEYCQRESITYMSQLRGFDFFKLLNVKGIGKGKFEDIRAVYETYLISKTDDETLGNGQKKYETAKSEHHENLNGLMFKNVNDELAEMDISLLSGLGIRRKMINRFMENGYVQIGDLKNISEFEVSRITENRKLKEFRNIEKTLSKNFVTIFADALENFTNERDFAIFQKRMDGKTLQELGKEYQLTRERIRQKIKNLASKIDVFMIHVLKLVVDDESYVIDPLLNVSTDCIQEKKLTNLYENEHYGKILVQWCKMNNDFVYLDFAKVFVRSRMSRDGIEEELLNIAESFIGEGMEWSKKIDELKSVMEENGHGYMDESSIETFLIQRGYKKYKDFLAKGKQSYGYLCSKVIAEKFPEGIRIYNKNDLDKLREYANTEYGDIGIPDSTRSFGARLSEFLVLSGRGKATAQSNIRVEESLLDSIRGFIENYDGKNVYYSEIFTKYEGEIREKSNIDNYNFLHGVLKLYFEGHYDFTNRDYLSKRGDCEVHDNSERIKEYIISAGRPASRRELKRNVVGFASDIVIFGAIERDAELIQWDYNRYYSLSLMDISKEDKDLLEESVRSIAKENKGYCSDNLLFGEVKKTGEDFLKKNRIKAAINLYFVCKKLLGNKFDFRRPHILEKGLIENISFKTVVPHLIGDTAILSLGDYQNLAKKLRWSSATTSAVFAEIEQNYMRLNEDMYMKNDNFKIGKEELVQIETVVRSLMTRGEKREKVVSECGVEERSEGGCMQKEKPLEYISMINLKIPEELPQIGHRWNAFLLRKVVERYIPNLKIIDMNIVDRRFERGIIVDENSILKTYDDVVIRTLMSLGYRAVTEAEMLKFLIEHNLICRAIPKELYTADGLIFKDGLFRIKEAYM